LPVAKSPPGSVGLEHPASAKSAATTTKRAIDILPSPTAGCRRFCPQRLVVFYLFVPRIRRRAQVPDNSGSQPVKRGED